MASNQAPAVYGGDEVAAVVLDQGSRWTRAGFAGEDTPKVVVATDYAQIFGDASDGKRYFGDNSVTYFRQDKEIVSPMSDGVVRDWDATQDLWEYCLKKELSVRLDERPLLITDQLWNTNENRTKAMELAFETLKVPAFYMVKSPVASLYATGKGSGLVVDVGAEVATVTPILDCLALYKPSRRSKAAGNFLSQSIARVLKERSITLNPHFRIGSKTAVSVGETAKWVPRPLTEKYTHSYFNFQAERVYHEFKESMVQVYETPLSEAPADETWPTRLFEFPDGYNSEFGIDRFNIGESLFKPDGSEAQEKSDNDDEMDVDGSPAEDGDEKKADTNLSSLVPPFSAKGISDLIIEAINSCDVDIRANLANNIVITGGTSLVQGFTQRVSNDLSQALSGFKIRIHAPGNTAERNYSSWIGGSILSSLGTFHQLWVSKKEYEEVGAEKLLERRFR